MTRDIFESTKKCLRNMGITPEDKHWKVEQGITTYTLTVEKQETKDVLTMRSSKSSMELSKEFYDTPLLRHSEH